MLDSQEHVNDSLSQKLSKPDCSEGKFGVQLSTVKYCMFQRLFQKHVCTSSLTSCKCFCKAICASKLNYCECCYRAVIGSADFTVDGLLSCNSLALWANLCKRHSHQSCLGVQKVTSVCGFSIFDTAICCYFTAARLAHKTLWHFHV